MELCARFKCQWIVKDERRRIQRLSNMAKFSNKLRKVFIKILVLTVVIVTLPFLLGNAVLFYLTRIQGAMALEHIYRRPKLNILVYYVLDGRVSAAQLRSRFYHRILCCTNKNGKSMYPELRQFRTPFLNYFFLKDDPQFDIKNHIRDYDYTGTMHLTEGSGENDLQRVMSGLLAEPWREDSSPWEILVVPNYHTEGSSTEKTVVMVRLHHSLADGYSILKMSMKLMDDTGVKLPQPNFQRLTGFHKFTEMVKMPFTAIYYVVTMLIDGFDGKHAWHLTDTKMSRKYNSCVVQKISIDILKEIKSKYGVNYNAVLATITAEGIVRIMEDAGQEVPTSMSVFMPLPLPQHPDGLVIHAGGMYTKWPLGLDSPVETLHAINSSMNKANVTGQLLASKFFVFLLDNYPICLGRFMQDKIMCTASFSSFPATREMLQTYGVNLVDAMFAFGLPCGKMGVNVTLLSYGEDQRIVVNIDKTVYGDEVKFHKMSEYVHQAVNQLLCAENLNV